MIQARKAKIQKFFRVTHGWLGLFVFPWILAIGLTGLYLNHSKLVLGWIGASSYDERQFSTWPQKDIQVSGAMIIAQSVWPEEDIESLQEDRYHGFTSYVFEKASGRIIVTQETGHYFVKSNLVRRTFAPDGSLLHRKIYWSSVFKWLHVRGWLNSDLGTWLADITGFAMVFFALSGLWLFFAPRLKRIARALRKMAPRRMAAQPKP